MNELEIRKIAKEEFISNVMNNLDSTLIFTYIQNLEQKVNNLQSKIDKAIEYLNEEYDVEPKELYGLVSADKLLEILKEVENVENN